MLPVNPWFLYILECCDNSLYTGITNRLTFRIEAHMAGTGARYTQSHRPVKLVYVEECEDRSSASKREWTVKKMSKSQKLELIKRVLLNPSFETKHNDATKGSFLSDGWPV